MGCYLDPPEGVCGVAMRNRDPNIHWDYSGYSGKIRDGIGGWEEWFPIPWWGSKERMNNQATDSYLQRKDTGSAFLVDL